MGYSYYYEPEHLSTGLTTILAVFGVFFMIACLLLLVLQIIAYWKLFQKAGQPGWKSLIPLYADYVLYGIAWKKSMFWITLAIGVVAGIGGTLLSSAITEMSVLGTLSVGSMATTIIGLLIWMLGIVAAFVIQIVLSIYLSRAFGHGGGYAVGLILLPTIFMLILGLGNSRYVKNETIIVE